MSRILLVEDNEMNRDMLSRRLAKRGYEVLVAATGSEAMAAARAENPDLILMDAGLPDISGWEVTRQLRVDPATSAIPIIALTAHALASDREQAFAAGCSDYESKPVDLATLLAKIERLLGSNAGETQQ
jgi:CheY-like chemotaxis protein